MWHNAVNRTVCFLPLVSEKKNIKDSRIFLKNNFTIAFLTMMNMYPEKTCVSVKRKIWKNEMYENKSSRSSENLTYLACSWINFLKATIVDLLLLLQLCDRQNFEKFTISCRTASVLELACRTCRLLEDLVCQIKDN